MASPTYGLKESWADLTTAPKWLAQNIVKPVIRGAVKMPAVFASGVLGRDVNFRIPGTSTELGSGHQYQNFADEKAGRITRAEFNAREGKALGENLGDALALGTSVGGGGLGKLGATLGGKVASRVGTELTGEALASALTATGKQAIKKAGQKIVQQGAKKYVVQGGGKLMTNLAKGAGNAATDYTLGAGFGAAGAIAEGKSGTDILKQANMTGLGGVAFPLAMGGVGKLAAPARSGLAKVILGSTESKFGNAFREAEIGWSAKAAAKEVAEKQAERELVKVNGADGVAKEFERRYLPDNFVAPNANRGIGGKLASLASAIKEKTGDAAASVSMSAVKGARRFNKTFFGSEAPIEAIAKYIEEKNPEGAARIRTNQSGYQARTDLAHGYALNMKDDVENGILHGDDSKNAALNMVSDIRTKLETPRTNVTPEERVALQKKLDDALAQFSPADRAEIEAAHKLSIQHNAENLDAMVDGELMSPEDAQFYKEKYPNYSKQVVKEHLEGGTSNFGGKGESRSIKNTGIKARKEGGQLDADTMTASEANALNYAYTQEKILTNKRNDAIITEGGEELSTPLWTKADGDASKVVVGLMSEHAGVKDALTAEVSAVKKGGRVELGKQKAADRAEATRLANEIKARARADGKTVRETYDNLMAPDIKAAKEAGTTELGKQTSAAKREADRLAKIARSVEGKGGAARTRSIVMETNGRSYNQATRDAVAKELGLLEETAGAMKAAGREQADALVAAGKADAVTAQYEFNQQAKERWDKIVAMKDEELRPLIDDLAMTNEAKSALYEQLQALRLKAKAAAASETAVPVFRGGVKELYEPKDPLLAEYFAHQRSEENKVPAWMEAATNFTKRFATQINPLFSLKNYLRDQQDRLANIGLGWSPKGTAKSLWHAREYAAGRLTPEVKEILTVGGPLSSGGYDVSSGFRRLVDKGQKKGAIGFIERAAETSELATRMNIYDEAIRAGITDKVKIRELMRNGTLDFSIAGDFTREANKAIPFLSAGVNGVRTYLKNVAKDPSGWARRQQMLAVYPTLLLDSYNSRYDSFKNVSQSEKELNFIISYGEGTDAEGKKYLKYFKIPKGQATRMVSNMTSIITNPRLTDRDAGDAIMKQFVSMIPIVNSASSNPVPTPFGTIGQTIYGIQSNQDYMGRDIVGQGNEKKAKLAQTNKYTSDLAKDATQTISDVTGGLVQFSPAKFEYFFRTIGSGFGSQMVTGLTNAYDASRGKEIKPSGTFLAGGFVGDSNSDVPLDVKYANKRLTQNAQDAEFEEQKKNEGNLEKLRDPNTPNEEKQALLVTLGQTGELPNFMEYAKTQVKKKSGVFTIDTTQTVNIQAAEFTNYLDTLGSNEEKKAAVASAIKNNLVTPSFLESAKAYKVYQRINGMSNAEKKQEIQRMIASGELNKNVLTKMAEFKKINAP